MRAATLPFKIELRAIEHIARASEETYCYAAKVYVDGKHVADVSNDGHGGCDHQHPAKGYTHKDIEALNKRIAETYPPAFEIKGKPHPSDLEIVCGELVTAWLIGKAMAKDLKRSVLFVTPEQPGLRQISLRQKGQQYLLKTMCDHVKGKYPGAKILNLLPHDVALALYKKHG